MSESFELPSVDAITIGTIGEPGSRVFYLQAWAGQSKMTLKVEKQQVAGLAVALREVLADLPSTNLLGASGLQPPIEAAWPVGGIGISTFDEATQRVTLLFEELVAEDDGIAATAHVGVTIDQMMALIERGEELVAGGRPNCALCGNPMDPNGHSCPKTNGHLRH